MFLTSFTLYPLPFTLYPLPFTLYLVPRTGLEPNPITYIHHPTIVSAPCIQEEVVTNKVIQ